MSAKLSTQSGFTLVELMVVIAIIAILASVGFTTYTSSQRAGRDSKRIADIQEIQKANEQYFAVNNKYAKSPLTTDSTPSFYSYFENQDPPTDPEASQVYTYLRNDPAAPSGSCNQDRYIVCSQLESCSGGKCMKAALPTDPCESPADPTPPTTSPGYYCVSALSN